MTPWIAENHARGGGACSLGFERFRDPLTERFGTEPNTSVAFDSRLGVWQDDEAMAPGASNDHPLAPSGGRPTVWHSTPIVVGDKRPSNETSKDEEPIDGTLAEDQSARRCNGIDRR